MAADQLALIHGYYRCADCGQDVARVRKTRRFFLCDSCWAAVMPDWQQVQVSAKRDPAWYAETSQEREKINAYWGWYTRMEKRYPAPPRISRAGWYLGQAGRGPTFTVDAYYPLCVCGQVREPMEIAGAETGLFGGPFRDYCPTCRAKKDVESYVDAARWLHPDWDDEEWLDTLYKIYPSAFAIGVLPDYWFVLRRSAQKKNEEQ